MLLRTNHGSDWSEGGPEGGTRGTAWGSYIGFNATSGVVALTITFSGLNGKSVKSGTKRMISESGNQACSRLSITSSLRILDSGPRALPFLLPLHFHAMFPMELSLDVRTPEAWKRLLPLAACPEVCLPRRLGHFQASLLVQFRRTPCALLDHFRSLGMRHFLGNCMDQCGTFCWILLDHFLLKESLELLRRHGLLDKLLLPWREWCQRHWHRRWLGQRNSYCYTGCQLGRCGRKEGWSWNCWLLGPTVLETEVADQRLAGRMLLMMLTPTMWWHLESRWCFWGWCTHHTVGRCTRRSWSTGWLCPNGVVDKMSGKLTWTPY